MTTSKIESETQTFFFSFPERELFWFVYLLCLLSSSSFIHCGNRHPSTKSDKQRSQRHSTNGLVCRERIHSLRFARVDRLFVRSGQTIIRGENDVRNKEIIIFEENTSCVCVFAAVRGRWRTVDSAHFRTFRAVVSATDLFWFWYHMEPTCLQTIEWFLIFFFVKYPIHWIMSAFVLEVKWSANFNFLSTYYTFENITTILPVFEKKLFWKIGKIVI